jgi:hypothetical protein
MWKFIGLCCYLVVVLSGGRQDPVFSKYKAIEAYEVRPGLLMTPRYSGDGQVCEIGLARLLYTPEKIRTDSAFGENEIQDVLLELVPLKDRGPKKENSLVDFVQSGRTIQVTENYEKVWITTVGLQSSRSTKNSIPKEDFVTVVKWKERKCK